MQKIQKLVGGILTAMFAIAIFSAPVFAEVKSGEITEEFMKSLSVTQAEDLRRSISEQIETFDASLRKCQNSLAYQSNKKAECNEDQKKKLIECYESATCDPSKDENAKCGCFLEQYLFEKISRDFQLVNIYLQKYVNVNLSGEGNEDTQTIGADLQLDGQEHFESGVSILSRVIDTLVIGVGTIAFIFIVVAGFRLLVSAGNDNEIENAKSMLTMSITGLVVALLAYVIIAAVRGLLY